MIIAVDFDGTIVTNRYPEIGTPNISLINWLKYQKDMGNELILWTCRTKEHLAQAVDFCKLHSLYFDAINDNLQSSINQFGDNGRKIHADVYIDDKAINPIQKNLHLNFG